MAAVVVLIALVMTGGCSGVWQTSPQADEPVREDPVSGPASRESVATQAIPDEEKGEDDEPSVAGEENAPDRAVTDPVSEDAAEDAAAEDGTEAESAGVAVVDELAVVKQEVPAPDAASAAPVETDAEEVPPLDLELLKKRLKETPAVGVFTKLALKNQVDDLLENFRAYYQGHSEVSLKQLRQPYEMLIMKVLVLLQDSDPTLARDILDSREAIWNVLADPEKFASI